MGSFKVVIQPSGVTVEANGGERLLDVVARAGVEIHNLCGGQGVCGKCRVRILRGHVNFPGKFIGLLDKKELESGYVLACQSQLVDEDVEIWIPPESRKEEDQILTVDHIVRYEQPVVLEEGLGTPGIPYFRPLCQKYYLKLPKPSLADNLSDMERIYRELRKKLVDTQLKADFSCLRDLSRSLRQNDWDVTATVHMRNLDCPRIRAFEPGDTSGRSYGVAIDVGTTTIVAELIDLRTGNIVGVEGSRNSQARYGEDVISRMIYACGHGGLPPLTDAVVTTTNSLVRSLVEGATIQHEDISCFVAAGNTTMTHLMLGLEPCAIRVEPYIPTAIRFPFVEAKEIGLRGHPKAVLHCMPCVSSYVGGDITAGVLASGMSDQPQVSALIDVGTNGEIAIGNSEWLVCCSASAGPAFEGGGIQCGMRGTRGAIEKVAVNGERISYKTIGGAQPRGVCGSGLIDVVAELVAERIIDQSGRFIHLHHPRVRVVDDIPQFVLAPADETETGRPVVVTEDDISNLIKSKGAVLAAMKVMLDNIGMSFEDLSQIYVAGGFGAHLDIERAIFIGLLPDIPRERIRFIGNSSLAGARLGLLSTHAFSKAEAIAKHMTYFELSVHPEFMNEFVAALFLPHTQMELFPTVRDSLTRRARDR